MEIQFSVKKTIFCDKFIFFNNWRRVLTRTFRPSLSIWTSFCHIVCWAPWTSVISFLLILHKLLDLKKNCKFYIFIIGMWNDLTMNRRNLFETHRQLFFKKWICRKKLFSLHQTGYEFIISSISLCKRYLYHKLLKEI